MKKKLLATVLTTGVLLMGLTACGSDSTKSVADSKVPTSGAEDTTEKELKEVNFGSPNNSGKLLFELLEVALEDGSLEEELNKVGYTGNYLTIDAAGPGINEAFASGSLDIAVYGDFPATTAKSNGIDTKVIGASTTVQAQAVIVTDDSGIKSVKELEGAKVAVGLGTNYQYFWDHYVAGEGLDKSKIEVVNSFDYGTLLTTGDVDAASVGYSTAYYYDKIGIAHILSDSTEHPDWTTEFLVVAKSDFIEENPEVGVAVNKALIRARQKIENDVAPLAEGQSNENLTTDMLVDMYKTIGYDGYDPANFITQTPQKLQEVIDFMYDASLIQSKPDSSEWIDTRYYEKAVEELNK